MKEGNRIELNNNLFKKQNQTINEMEKSVLESFEMKALALHRTFRPKLIHCKSLSLKARH